VVAVAVAEVVDIKLLKVAQVVVVAAAVLVLMAVRGQVVAQLVQQYIMAAGVVPVLVQQEVQGGLKLTHQTQVPVAQVGVEALLARQGHLVHPHPEHRLQRAVLVVEQVTIL
jgi:hypothetical protein